MYNRSISNVVLRDYVPNRSKVSFQLAVFYGYNNLECSSTTKLYCCNYYFIM